MIKTLLGRSSGLIDGLRSSSVKNVNTCMRLLSTSNVVSQSQENDPKQSTFFIEDRKDKGYVIFKMNKAPVNSLSLEFLTDLNIQMEKIEQSKDINGVILTSNIPNIFSAGLDLTELYQPKPDRLKQFWNALQDFWITLYGSRKTYIAAINGHAIAGGCLIGFSCDYRIMASGAYKIGLNETDVGIVPPFWLNDALINTIGYRESEKMLQFGLLYSPEKALEIKLIDEIAESKNLIVKAEEQMNLWLSIPTIPRELTKIAMRRDIINKLLAQKETYTSSVVDYICQDTVQNYFKNYFDKLKKPKKN